jgi:hypothetical protein
LSKREGDQSTTAVSVAAVTSTPAVRHPTQDVSPAAAFAPRTAEQRDADSRRRRILLAPKQIVLPSCQAAPGLLAYVSLSKFGDHLPYYRQEAITERYGILFNRSTAGDWMLDLAGLLQELYELMIDNAGLKTRDFNGEETRDFGVYRGWGRQPPETA